MCNNDTIAQPFYNGCFSCSRLTRKYIYLKSCFHAICQECFLYGGGVGMSCLICKIPITDIKFYQNGQQSNSNSNSESESSDEDNDN